MLISSDISHAPTVQKLTEIWAERYQPQLPLSAQSPFFANALAQAVSPEGRRQTVAKLHRSLIKLNCEFAMTQTHNLHDYATLVANPYESKRIVQCTVEIYLNLLDRYQQSLPVSLPAGAEISQQNNRENCDPLALGLSALDLIDVANGLEPLLLEYQDRHQVSDDWARLGFLTTHINFSNMALLNHLTTAERVFLKPYLRFVEEQVALPWQRICAAASVHQFSSPAFQLVNRLLPQAEEIAQRVYMNLLRQFPQTTMKRGRLDHPGVRHSCIRDLNMFQAYLWLCVLQGSLSPVEDELVRLCIMVMTRVGVPWEMTVQWNELLMAEVLDRTLISQQAFLAPYMAGFIQAFQQSQSQFVAES